MITTLQHNSKHHANAVVLSFGGHAEAYDIVRSLGMDGIESIVASCQPHNIAFYSRYSARRVVLPSFETANESIIADQLKQLSTDLGGKPTLFYGSDAELSFVWRFRKVLQSCYRFLLPQDETLEYLFNKALFNKFAIEYQLPVPQSIIISNIDELDSIVSSIRFPCIVKPAYSQDWVWETEEQEVRFGPYKKALRRFTSAGELMRFCEALPHRASGFLIQPYIDGRDETIISFHGYFDEQSRCLGYFVGRKIRTYPPHTGGSVYVQTIHNQELAQQSIGYLQRIGFQGIVKIDYKLDQADNEFKMLEINPRYNLWELLGGYAGVNLAAIAHRHQMEEHVELNSSYRDDVRLLFLKQDIRAYLSGYCETKEWTLSSYVKSLMGKKYYRVWDLTDPLPFIVSVARFTRRHAFRFFTSMVARSNILSSRLQLTTINNKKNSFSLMKNKNIPHHKRKEHIRVIHSETP
jgi:D-aspartate ligase